MVSLVFEECFTYESSFLIMGDNDHRGYHVSIIIKEKIKSK